MWRNDLPPLSPLAEEALEILTAATDADDGEGSPSLSPEQAQRLLTDADFEPADADHAIDRLLKRGYLYEVDGTLFIADPDR